MTSSQSHWISTARGRLYAQSWKPVDGPADIQAAPIILLHDSLGCAALWRDFPEQLARATGRQVIAYDRLGFGRSDPRPEKLPVSFVQDEALGDFAGVLRHFGIESFVVFGHSVGGGMAVGVAARHPGSCVALVTEAAQSFIEPLTLDGIRTADRQFAVPGQLDRLQKYHGDKTEWVLRAWVDTWLSEPFQDWNLDADLPAVTCPALCFHGDQDEYGSLLHPRRIADKAGGPVTLRILPGCGHVPHREQTQTVLAEINRFLQPG